jgi:N-methylhydantoinase B
VILNGLREDGRPFNSFYLPGGGMGAAEGHDGLDCTLYPTNTTVTPIEIFEATAPVVVERKALLTDSGGPGAWRGGAGQQVVIQSISERPLTVTLRPEDKVRPPTGLSGGGPGSACRVYLDGEQTDADLIVLQPGERLIVETPGGGGFGDPSKRQTDAVIDDLASGLVSASAAEHVYRLDPSLLHAASRDEAAHD